MAAASWLIGGLLAVMCSVGMFFLSFCGSNIVPQFFCNIPSLLKISCSKYHVAVDVSVTAGAVLGLPGFILIIFSYVRIFRAVLRMPVPEGRTKAFSACLSHLAVVTIFISAAAFVYLKPPSDSSSIVDLLVSVFYSVVPPIPGWFAVSAESLACRPMGTEYFILTAMSSNRYTSICLPLSYEVVINRGAYGEMEAASSPAPRTMSPST
ncbi:olfactory receptor 14A2-like [Tachyglossus aculeatus]|uniref:olfactory receptor 14A2-like n=1 Tax=Tachyglossus aculeatus TaxID=9261 RepID=UPI0018F71ADD|nr:olfactory receptor 14A2-like [Tachyglossus aculeatus]